MMAYLSTKPEIHIIKDTEKDRERLIYHPVWQQTRNPSLNHQKCVCFHSWSRTMQVKKHQPALHHYRKWKNRNWNLGMDQGKNCGLILSTMITNFSFGRSRGEMVVSLQTGSFYENFSQIWPTNVHFIRNIFNPLFLTQKHSMYML